MLYKGQKEKKDEMFSICLRRIIEGRLRMNNRFYNHVYFQGGSYSRKFILNLVSVLKRVNLWENGEWLSHHSHGSSPAQHIQHIIIFLCSQSPADMHQLEHMLIRPGWHAEHLGHNLLLHQAEAQE